MKVFFFVAALWTIGVSPPQQTPIASVIARIQLEGPAPMPYLFLSFTDSAGLLFRSDLAEEDGVITAQVPPGEYRVSASPISTGYAVTEILLNSGNLNGALRIEPNTTANITVRVRASFTPVRVSGRVIQPSESEPVQGRITLFTPPSSWISTDTLAPRPLAAPVRADGSFEFGSVMPGNYLAAVEVDPAVQGNRLLSLLPEPQPVTIGNAGAAGIEIAVPHQVRLAGRTVVEDAGPVPHPVIEASFVSSTIQSLRLAGTPQMDGKFEWILPEGRYRFGLRDLLPGYEVKSMRYGDQDVLGQPVLISAASTELVVGIGRTAPLRKISGSVVDSPNPTSTSSISVALLRTGMISIETTVGIDGKFEFSGVPPGSYTLIVRGTSALGSRLTSIGNASAGPPIITVTDRNIEDVRIISNGPATSILGNGRVIVEGDGPMPRFSLTFNGGGGSTDPSSIDGTFRGWMPVGTSRVVVKELPKEYTLKGLTYGDIDLLQNELVVDAARTDELRIVVAPAANQQWKRLTGRLTGMAQLGTANVRLALLSLSHNSEVPVAADGSFVFPQMLSGTYNAMLRFDNGGADQPVATGVQIEIADADIAGLELPVPRSAEIKISTVAGLLSPASLHASILRLDMSNRTLNMYAVSDTAKGYFGEGDRLDVWRVPFGYRVRTMTYGAIDLLKEPIQFGNSPPESISIVLEPVPVDPRTPEFSLKGQVLSATTNASGKRVTATYVAPEHLSVSYTAMETVVRADGSFQFDRLRRGPYEIRIVGQPEVSRVIVGEDSDSVTISIP